MRIPDNKELVKHWNSLINMTNIPEEEPRKSLSRLNEETK
jgi:hypothetical protein